MAGKNYLRNDTENTDIKISRKIWTAYFKPCLLDVKCIVPPHSSYIFDVRCSNQFSEPQSLSRIGLTRGKTPEDQCVYCICPEYIAVITEVFSHPDREIKHKHRFLSCQKRSSIPNAQGTLHFTNDA